MSSFDAVKYLVLRMFPAKLVHLARLDIGKGKLCLQAEAYIEKVRNYVTTLRALSDESLMAMVEDERQHDAARVRLSMGFFSATGTFTSTWGKRSKSAVSSLRQRPVVRMIARAWSAVVRLRRRARL